MFDFESWVERVDLVGGSESGLSSVWDLLEEEDKRGNIDPSLYFCLGPFVVSSSILGECESRSRFHACVRERGREKTENETKQNKTEKASTAGLDRQGLNVYAFLR